MKGVGFYLHNKTTRLALCLKCISLFSNRDVVPFKQTRFQPKKHMQSIKTIPKIASLNTQLSNLVISTTSPQRAVEIGSICSGHGTGSIKIALVASLSFIQDRHRHGAF